MRIKVLIADDHKLVREGFRKILENESSFEVVGETCNGRSAVEMARKILPTVVLMDLSMPEMNGIDAIRQITAELPKVSCLALSMHSSEKFITEALGAGAKGYLLKDSAARELIEAVQAAADDRVYLSQRVAIVIAQDYHRRLSAVKQPGEENSLSSRERQTLQLIAEGKNTKEIAFILGVSVKTVESHRAMLMKKLDLRSIADLVKYAIREGITTLE